MSEVIKRTAWELKGFARYRAVVDYPVPLGRYTTALEPDQSDDGL
ncbi:MAG: hypothetical protein AAGB34_03065 [Planctomycetota bacterium]